MLDDLDEVGIYADDSSDLWISSSCWSWGPIEVCARFERDKVRGEIKILGQSIGSFSLSKDNATTEVGANVGLAKAKVKLVADFTAKHLKAEAQACYRGGFPPKWKCENWNGIILSW